MGNDYDSFGDFFHDVAEEYGKMSDTSLDSGDAHPLNKFVSDLAEAASRANGNHSEGRQGIDAEEVDVDVPRRNPGRRSGGREIPDPPSLGDVDVGVSRGGERRSEGRGNRGSGGRKGLDAENVDLEYSGGGDRDVVDERPGISERNLEAMVENDYISRSEASTLKEHLGKKKHLTSEQIQRMGGEHGIISGNLKNRLLRALDGGKGHVMEVSGGGGVFGTPSSSFGDVDDSFRPKEGVSRADFVDLYRRDVINANAVDSWLNYLQPGEYLTKKELRSLADEGDMYDFVKRTCLEVLNGERLKDVPRRPASDYSSSGMGQTGQSSQVSQEGDVPEGVDVSEFGPEHIVELAEKGVLEEGEARTILERMGVDIPGGQSKSWERGRGRGSQGRGGQDSYEEDGEISVDEMVEKFQRELERNR